MSKNKIAFVCPRYPESGTVGGAETLMKNLAERAAESGMDVTFLATCAKSHFTWKNELPAGLRRIGKVDVRLFSVDSERDVSSFLSIQSRLGRGVDLSIEEERLWVTNSVNSTALCNYIREHGAEFDRIILGPYLFGLIFFASQILPEKSLLVPCLHDEPFAYLKIMHEMFGKVRGFLFNSEPEKDLARRIYGLPEARCAVVGMGLDSVDADPAAFAARHGIKQPYVMYAGRREGGKGTPLLTDYVNAFRNRTGIDVKLVFTGSGPIEAPPEMAPHILDFGFVSEQEKHEAMAGALAFIHPSVFESFGIVLLESFLAGAPALVHSGGEVLKWQCQRSNAGFWFGLYPEFEEELLMLVRNKELRRAMGENGRKYVLSQYSWAAVEKRFEQALLM